MRGYSRWSLLLLLLQSWTWLPSMAFVVPPSTSTSTAVTPSTEPHRRMTTSSSSTRLYYIDPREESFHNRPPPKILERASLYGVSISPDGFQLLLQSHHRGYWNVPCTRTTKDAQAATSVPALTLLQLLSGVDMAGAVLPPDVLARLVVLHVGEQSSSSAFSANDDDDKLQKLRNDIHKSQPPQDHDDDDDGSSSYDWQQLPELPTATLDQLTLVQNNQNDEFESWHCRFHVRLDQYDLQLEFQPSQEHYLEQLQTYPQEQHETTTEAWWGLALALRYKAPIVVESSSNRNPTPTSLDELQNQFPQLLTAQTLHSNAQRLTTNIETAFAETKHSKWYKALEIAHQKGDTQAAEKIQALIHQLESQDKDMTTRDDSISSASHKRDEGQDADWDSLHVDADTGAWQ